MAMHLPLSILTNPGHDAAWLVGSAQSILRGRWLGDFNQMTLIKGLGYPYFLLFNNLLGTPVTLAQALLYLGACTWLIYNLRRAGLPATVTVLLFGVLIFQPALFPTRVIRDGIYFSLLLISFAGLIYVTLRPTGSRYSLPLIIASGFCLGIFWITREEGLWVAPGFAVMAALSIYENRKQGRDRGVLTGLCIYIVSALVAPIATGLANKITYGEFQIVDFKSASFVGALDALNSVVVGEDIQFLPVPHKKRVAIYKVSPSFKELEPLLEGSLRGWMDPGCKAYKSTCGDYAGGWFMWAFRDGVSALGYYRNPESARRFYDRISTEVKAACARGDLVCRRGGIPFMPPITDEAMRSIPGKILDAIGLTVYKKHLTYGSGESFGSARTWTRTLDFLGNPRVVPLRGSEMLSVSGWYFSKKADWIYLSCGTDPRKSYIPVKMEDGPNVDMNLNDETIAYRGFSFDLLGFEACRIDFRNDKIEPIMLPGLLENKKSFIEVADGVIHFDRVVVSKSHKGAHRVWMGKFARPFEAASVYLFCFGSAALVIVLYLIAFFGRRLDKLMIIAISAWILYFSRIALVVLVDVTSFPAVHALYLMPAFPLWIVGSFLSIASLLNGATGVFWPRRGPIKNRFKT